MATVSIVIPVHNPEAHLRPALASIHAQSVRNWDAVVVDDNSAEDLSWVSAEFPQVRQVRQPHGGVSVARNTGVLSTAGEFVAFMDQDDLWRPDKLRRQIEAMRRQPDAAVCYCDLQVIEADDTLTSVVDRSLGEAEPVVELDGTASTDESTLLRSLRYFSQRFVVPSTVLIRRSALATSGLLDPFIPFSGDYDLLIKLGSKHKVIRVPSADVLYRKHANNFSDRYEVGRQEVKALIGRYVAVAKAQGDRELARQAPRLIGRPRRLYAAQAFDNARRGLKHGDYSALCRHLWRAVWFSPAFVTKSLIKWGVTRLQLGRSVLGRRHT